MLRCFALLQLCGSIFATSFAQRPRFDYIEDAALAISDPRSEHFRQFLTPSEAQELASLLPSITYTTSPVTTKAARVQPRHTDTKRQPVLEPKDVCIDNGLVTPDCIRQAYKIDYAPQPDRVTFAVYATEAATYNPNDLNSFLKQYRPEAQGAAYEIIGNGDSSESSNVGALFETALDTQTLLGTAWPAKGVLYNLGGVFGPQPGQPYQPFVQFLSDIISNETVPSVISFSESMPEDMMDADYARSLCQTFALAGARGVTFMFSSGDNGPNGDTSIGTHKQVFETEFPASCPWVTAVGGTSNIADETAATSSTIPAFDATFYTASGGGFSQLFETPAYQKDVVEDYITQHVPASYQNISGFNSRGRGVPDIAAFSTNVPVVVNGASLPLGGTSASTPLWAAVVALLNDYEADNGRPALGFLNPWLYSLQRTGKLAALKDIVTGGNNKGGCNVLAGCQLPETLGYDVVQGWDPVTGLGSPVFVELLQALDDLADDC